MDELIPMIFFVMIAAIVIVPRYFKSLERQKMQETLRAAIEKGQPLPAEVVEAMTRNVTVKRAPSPQRDLRRGVVLLCVAAALVTLGYLIGLSEPDAFYPLVGVAAFPAFIGLAFVVMSFVFRDKA